MARVESIKADRSRRQINEGRRKGKKGVASDREPERNEQLTFTVVGRCLSPSTATMTSSAFKPPLAAGLSGNTALTSHSGSRTDDVMSGASSGLKRVMSTPRLPRGPRIIFISSCCVWPLSLSSSLPATMLFLFLGGADTGTLCDAGGAERVVVALGESPLCSTCCCGDDGENAGLVL